MTGFVTNIVKHAALYHWKLTDRQGQIILCLFSKPGFLWLSCSNMTGCSRHSERGLIVMIAVQCVFFSACVCVLVCANSPQRHLLQVSGTCCGIKELAVTNNLMRAHTLACMHSSHRTTPHNYNPRPPYISTHVPPVFESRRLHLNSSLLSSFNSALLYWILVTAVLKKRYLSNNESRRNVRLTLVKDKVIGRGKPSCQRLPFSEKETQ